jgi:hypothetical protein
MRIPAALSVSRKSACRTAAARGRSWPVFSGNSTFEEVARRVNPAYLAEKLEKAENQARRVVERGCAGS